MPSTSDSRLESVAGKDGVGGADSGRGPGPAADGVPVQGAGRAVDPKADGAKSPISTSSSSAAAMAARSPPRGSPTRPKTARRGLRARARPRIPARNVSAAHDRSRRPRAVLHRRRHLRARRARGALRRAGRRRRERFGRQWTRRWLADQRGRDGRARPTRSGRAPNGRPRSAASLADVDAIATGDARAARPRCGTERSIRPTASPRSSTTRSSATEKHSEEIRGAAAHGEAVESAEHFGRPRSPSRSTEKRVSSAASGNGQLPALRRLRNGMQPRRQGFARRQPAAHGRAGGRFDLHRSHGAADRAAARHRRQRRRVRPGVASRWLTPMRICARARVACSSWSQAR